MTILLMILYIIRRQKCFRLFLVVTRHWSFVGTFVLLSFDLFLGIFDFFPPQPHSSTSVSVKGIQCVETVASNTPVVLVVGGVGVVALVFRTGSVNLVSFVVVVIFVALSEDTNTAPASPPANRHFFFFGRGSEGNPTLPEGHKQRHHATTKRYGRILRAVTRRTTGSYARLATVEILARMRCWRIILILLCPPKIQWRDKIFQKTSFLHYSSGTRQRAP